MNKKRKQLVNVLEVELSNHSPTEIKEAIAQDALNSPLLAIFDRCLAQAQRRRAYKQAQREEAQLRK